MEMGGACETCGYLLHVGHAAHVPLSDVLVEDRRPTEHVPVRRHAAEGGMEGGRSVRSRYTVCGVQGGEWFGVTYSMVHTLLTSHPDISSLKVVPQLLSR